MTLIGKKQIVPGANFSAIAISGQEEKELQSITVTTMPQKMTYVLNEDFNPYGMVVTATLIGKISGITTQETVTGYTYTPTTFTTEGNVSVTISYTLEDITKTTTIQVEVLSGAVDYSLVQGYWSTEAKSLPNRVCNDALIKGIQNIKTNTGYVIRAVYKYNQYYEFPQPTASSLSGIMEAQTSTSRTDYTTLDPEGYYGVTFAKTDASSSILPTENIVQAWTYVE